MEASTIMYNNILDKINVNNLLLNSAKVKEFNNNFNVKKHSKLCKDVLTKDPKLTKLRLDLITEEVEELKEAIKNNDVIETIDALADILYVVYGAADCFGIDIGFWYCT